MPFAICALPYKHQTYRVDNMNICLYGSGSRKIDETYTDEAVHDNGGKSIGIAPEWIGDFEPLCKDCTRFIYVDSMDERKREFVNNSDAFIISPGGIGTLDEFFEIITLKKLKRHDKQIIVFNINHFFDTMLRMIDEMGEKGFLYKQEEIFKVATTVDEIFEILEP